MSPSLFMQCSLVTCDWLAMSRVLEATNNVTLKSWAHFSYWVLISVHVYVLCIIKFVNNYVLKSCFYLSLLALVVNY